VQDIMSAPFVYIGPEATIDECMAIMTERRFRHLPVLDDAELVGIVSIGDVVKFHAQQQDVQIKFLTEFISG
jgi:CBS domain-containing protein